MCVLEGKIIGKNVEEEQKTDEKGEEDEEHEKSTRESNVMS